MQNQSTNSLIKVHFDTSQLVHTTKILIHHNYKRATCKTRNFDTPQLVHTTAASINQSEKKKISLPIHLSLISKPLT